MKFKVILSCLVSFWAIGTAIAQVEQDDMYFNSKDRAKLREAKKVQEAVYASVKKNKPAEQEDTFINPTDSYSARNINPEFTSRSQSQTAQEDEANYFVNNYQYNSKTNYNNWNNNFNNWYNNPWYRNNYWAPSIYAWNSPYYGYYNSWNSPWNDPYWAYNGYSTSFSYYYGPSWNYGWGGYYNYWNQPYYSNWNAYYGYGFNYGYGMGWYWNNYRNINNVIIVAPEGTGKGIAYGKRPTRGSYSVNNRDSYDNNRTRSSVTTGRNEPSTGRVITGGRQAEYYNRSWRNSESYTPPASSYDSRSSTQQNRPSSWSNSNNSWQNNTPSYTPSTSRSSSSGFESSGGTRSHSSSGSGSNGRSRGRD